MRELVCLTLASGLVKMNKINFILITILISCKHFHPPSIGGGELNLDFLTHLETCDHAEVIIPIHYEENHQLFTDWLYGYLSTKKNPLGECRHIINGIYINPNDRFLIEVLLDEHIYHFIEIKNGWVLKAVFHVF
jgi:hypothetical protein